MKKTFILILVGILGLILLSALAFHNRSYEVIGVVEGDLIYIDLNKNKIKDENELFHLKGVNSFPLKINQKVKIYTEKFDLNEREVFGLGILAKEFTEKTLLNNKVKFLEKPDEYNPDYNYRFGKISFNDMDYGKILLENGLGSAYWGKSGAHYLIYENKEKIKENVKKIDTIKIVENEKSSPDINDEYNKSPVEDKNKEKRINRNVKSSIKLENLSLYLLNPNNAKPNNKCTNEACKMLLTNINNAAESIDLAIYGIENQNEILNALKNAKSRGVKLRCVTDTNPNGEYTYVDTDKLKDICEIKGDNTNHFMHNKFFIFDNKTVLTGSSNISPTGIGGYNSNSIIVIKNDDVALVYKKEFEQMFEGNFQDKKVNVSAKGIKINENTEADIYFSPNGKIYENVFRTSITNAKKSIYIDVFYLTHKEIASDLIKAQKRGVEIKIIIDATSARNPKSKLKELREAGIDVKVENWGGKAHEKTMSVDNNYLVLGSANFTNSGMNHNDENLLVIYNPEIAKFYNEFFLLLYDSIDNKYLIKIPSAESFSSKNSCNDGIDNDFDGKIDKEDDGCISFKK